MNKAYLIVTDSDDIQEKDPEQGNPVFDLRDTTERIVDILERVLEEKNVS